MPTHMTDHTGAPAKQNAILTFDEFVAQKETMPEEPAMNLPAEVNMPGTQAEMQPEMPMQHSTEVNPQAPEEVQPVVPQEPEAELTKLDEPNAPSQHLT